MYSFLWGSTGDVFVTSWVRNTKNLHLLILGTFIVHSSQSTMVTILPQATHTVVSTASIVVIGSSPISRNRGFFIFHTPSTKRQASCVCICQNVYDMFSSTYTYTIHPLQISSYPPKKNVCEIDFSAIIRTWYVLKK